MSDRLFPESQPLIVHCGDCAHLVSTRWRSRRVFFKCELYDRKGYEGTDWRARWPACGQFTPLTLGGPRGKA
jgi:hypothetical protein